MTKLNELTISETINGLKNKEFSALEVVNAYIDQMQENKKYNAYVTQTPELALEQAKIADTQYNRGIFCRSEAFVLLNHGKPVRFHIQLRKRTKYLLRPGRHEADKRLFRLGGLEQSVARYGVWLIISAARGLVKSEAIFVDGKSLPEYNGRSGKNIPEIQEEIHDGQSQHGRCSTL